jgi:hypothetical protein
MEVLMNRSIMFSMLLAVVTLAGCSTAPGPEQRPYTAEESHELALEALNRRGLSFDDYQHQKTLLQRQQVDQDVAQRAVAGAVREG